MSNNTPAPIGAMTSAADLGLSGPMSPAIQILLNEQLWDRCTTMATRMSKATGMVPAHLIGCPEACFAVVTRALTWKLDPFAVAQCTYSPAPGKVGYEGKLCQAILENSGKIEGNVKFRHYGEWGRLRGKFKKEKSPKSGRDYAVPNWADKDEDGLGVTVIIDVKGEVEPRTYDFDLIQAFPRNSTLWATDPRTQICYTAVRRAANIIAPGLFMGVPFDAESVDGLRAAGELVKRADGSYEFSEDIPDRPTRNPNPAAEAEAARKAAQEMDNQDRVHNGRPPADETVIEPDDEERPDLSPKAETETQPEPEPMEKWAKAIAEKVGHAKTGQKLAAILADYKDELAEMAESAPNRYASLQGYIEDCKAALGIKG